MADDKSFGGNRGVGAEVTMSFMCSSEKRDEIRKAAKSRGVAISTFIRDAIDKQLKEVK